MKREIVLALFLGNVQSYNWSKFLQYDQKDQSIKQQHPVRQEIVDLIGERTTKWKARDPSLNVMSQMSAESIALNSLGSLGMKHKEFNMASLIIEPIKALADTFEIGQEILQKVERNIQNKLSVQSAPSDIKPDPIFKEIIKGDTDLPQEYNVREQYTYCKADILEQGYCGSCWAFASAGVLSDRLCQQTEGEINVTLSPQDMINCDRENYGCAGGYLIPAIDFLVTEGVATETCVPYVEEKEHCNYECKNAGIKKEEEKEHYVKHYCKSGSFKVHTQIDEMQKEIYENGPVMLGLIVWDDMYNYESGIYSKVAGDVVGGHAIRAVGWGHDPEDGSLYWICQNQWSIYWGEMGYINIKAGSFYIDTWALSCQPDLENPLYDMTPEVNEYNVVNKKELDEKIKKYNPFQNKI